MKYLPYYWLDCLKIANKQKEAGIGQYLKRGRTEQKFENIFFRLGREVGLKHSQPVSNVLLIVREHLFICPWTIVWSKKDYFEIFLLLNLKRFKIPITWSVLTNMSETFWQAHPNSERVTSGRSGSGNWRNWDDQKRQKKILERVKIFCEKCFTVSKCAKYNS